MESGRNSAQIPLDIPTFIPLSIIHLMTLVICMPCTIRKMRKGNEGDEIFKRWSNQNAGDVHGCARRWRACWLGPWQAAEVAALWQVSSDQDCRHDRAECETWRRKHTQPYGLHLYLVCLPLTDAHIFWETPQDERFFSTTSPTLLVPVTVSSSSYTLQLLLLLFFPLSSPNQTLIFKIRFKSLEYK